MPCTFGADEPDSVAILIDKTAEAVAEGLRAFHRGKLTALQKRDLAKARSHMGELMAYYTDGDGHGAIPGEMLQDMWKLGQMASEILEAIAMRESKHEQVKLRPGRYKLTRTIKASPPVSREVECNNPAYGNKILDDWEEQMRAALSANETRRAKSREKHAA